MTQPDDPTRPAGDARPEQERRLIDAALRAAGDVALPADEPATQTAGSDSPPGSSSFVNLPPRDLIPGYDILREIHRGGQGVVYQALQVATGRKVAVKVMHEGPHGGPAARERFKREIQLIAALDHPNIVKVVDSGINQDRYYYAMDYIGGKPLDAHVRQSGLPIDQVLRTFAKICDAVQYAHRRGVVHRDLKPGNILVDRRGEPHVLDFGMAKVAAGEVIGGSRPMLISITGQVLGTLPYMSPEQASGNPDHVDSRTDVYSLGVILYQLLTGEYPYEVVGNMRDVLDRILTAAPRRPSTFQRRIDHDLETIVLKALAKEPERRYQSASDLGRDLERFIAGQPVEAKRASGWYVLRKRMQRHRRAVVATSVFALIVAALGIVLAR